MGFFEVIWEWISNIVIGGISFIAIIIGGAKLFGKNLIDSWFEKKSLKFSTLHQERVALIKGVYKQIKQFETDLELPYSPHATLTDMKATVYPSLIKNYLLLDTSLKECLIFFSELTANKLSSGLSSFYDVLKAIKLENEQDFETAKEAIFNAKQEKLSPAIKLIEKDFRKLLGA